MLEEDIKDINDVMEEEEKWLIFYIDIYIHNKLYYILYRAWAS